MTVTSATFLSGAKGRLMPPGLIFSFFLAAALFHVAAWGMLAVASPEAPGFMGGPGPSLASVHLLTLGVFMMTAMGAAMQLLTVATKQAIRSFTLCRVVAVLYIPSVAALLHGMANNAIWFMIVGGLVAVIALLIFAGLIADNVRRAKGMGVVIAHCWAALAALVGLAILGFVLIADFHHFFLTDHHGFAVAHFIVAAFGFMGLLAFGFTQVLVPMFALANAPPSREGYLTLAMAIGAIVAGSAGAIAGISLLVLLGGVVGLIAAVSHGYSLHKALKKRMRKNLGISFVLVRSAWVLLPASLSVGLLAYFDLAGPNGATLFGFLVLFGWLLTFLMGIFQRIIPFLATMHAGGGAGSAPLTVADLNSPKALNIHAWCHGCAVAVVAAGIAIDSPLAVAAGAGIGVVGAGAFLYFAAAAAAIMFGRLKSNRAASAEE